jgi:hypothetical protein
LSLPSHQIDEVCNGTVRGRRGGAYLLDQPIELGDDITQPEVAREVLARRIIAAARLGERDPVRLQAAALRKPD